jgi:hypothetical protein
MIVPTAFSDVVTVATLICQYQNYISIRRSQLYVSQNALLFMQSKTLPKMILRLTSTSKCVDLSIRVRVEVKATAAGKWQTDFVSNNHDFKHQSCPVVPLCGNFGYKC